MGEAKQIEIKNQTYYFFQRRDQSPRFRIKLYKKSITKKLIYTTLDTFHLKKLMIVKILTV